MSGVMALSTEQFPRPRQEMRLPEQLGRDQMTRRILDSDSPPVREVNIRSACIGLLWPALPASGIGDAPSTRAW